MKTRHIFSLAVLALMTAACSNKEDIALQNPSAPAVGTIPFTATITSSAGTRSLTEAADGKSIAAHWEKGEQVALIHGKSIDVMSITEVGDNGTATITGDMTNSEDDPLNNGDPAFVVYFGHDPAGMDELKKGIQRKFEYAKYEFDQETIEYYDVSNTADSLIRTMQDGTLETINNRLDYHQGETTLAVNNGRATLAQATKLEPMFSIWKFSLTDGTSAIKAKTFTLKVESVPFNLKFSEPVSEFYLMFNDGSEENSFFATDANGNYYAKFLTLKKSSDLGTYYQSTLELDKLEDIEYMDYTSGEPTPTIVSPKDYTLLWGTIDPDQLTGKWFVVTGEAKLNHQWKLSEKETNIILCDGAQLTTEGGIFRLEGAAGDCLNIFAQSEGTGKIIVNAADEESVAISCDVLNIHGGQLSITNSLYSGIAAAVFSMWSGKLEVSTTNDASHAILPGTTVKLYNDLQLFERNSPEEKWGSVAPNADTVNEYISAKPYVKIEAPSPGFNANDPFGKGGDPLAGGN